MDNLTEDIIVKDVPFLVHEGDMARMERTIHRQWITIIVLIAALIMSFVGFSIYESQFEEQVITQDISQNVDTDGNAVIAGIGDAIYGNESESASQNNG